MKIIYLFLLLSSLAISAANAQIVVDGVDINKIEELQYCQIVAQAKFLSAKVTIAIDYGQEPSYGRATKIIDRHGKPVVFNSVIQALNFMYDNGWKYLDAYTLTEGNSNVYHYTLERKE